MTSWLRVTRKNPCPICKHPDWCCIGDRFINCMRSESAKPCRNGGWLHALDASAKPPPPRLPPERLPEIDAAGIMARFVDAATAEMVEQFAGALGVTSAALESLGIGWAVGHNAWAFPMRTFAGKVIGIRLRDASGHKWAVKGSRAGLFFADYSSDTVYISEGPTDTAAGLSIGLDVIGRPSCLGSEAETDRLLVRKKAKRAIICSDNDGPGYRGAVKLSESLSVPSCIWVSCAKDLREFVQFGGTKDLIDSLTRSLIWNQPKKTDSSLTQQHGDPVLWRAGSRQA